MMIHRTKQEGIKILLNMEGFNQKGQCRLTKLSTNEIHTLIDFRPQTDRLWPTYVNEIQSLLRIMDVARKSESNLGNRSSMGRPYVIDEIASATCKLACLRHLQEKGIEMVSARKLRVFLLARVESELSELLQEMEQEQQVQTLGSTVTIHPAVQLLELYRNELMTPPRIRSRQTFDEFERHDIEVGDFSWHEDGGKSYLEAIRDMPMETHYDDIPKLLPVLDWFIATKPVFDKNQLKRGWKYMERSSDSWHLRNVMEGYSVEKLADYLSWNCIVAERIDEWVAVLPQGSPFKLVSLITPQQLLEESIAMHNCVVTYVENCIGGETRIFSVRDASGNQRFATAELSHRSSQWQLVQLKGKFNLELIHRLQVASNPLAIVLNALVAWYNKHDKETTI